MSRWVEAGAEFGALFRSFTRTAWRWETQLEYREPEEREPFRRFLAGEHDDLAWRADWLAGIREATAAGRWFGRVRVLSDPLTDYLRFELAHTPDNIQAGEDIRVMPEARARELGMPRHDFWLFDDQEVAVLHFGPGGLEGAELTTDPDIVRQHTEWRRLAWEHASPFEITSA